MITGSAGSSDWAANPPGGLVRHRLRVGDGRHACENPTLPSLTRDKPSCFGRDLVGDEAHIFGGLDQIDDRQVVPGIVDEGIVHDRSVGPSRGRHRRPRHPAVLLFVPVLARCRAAHDVCDPDLGAAQQAGGCFRADVSNRCE
jgi:hypothetical protein